MVRYMRAPWVDGGRAAAQPWWPLWGLLLELSEYARAILRGWWIVVACAVAGIAAALAVTSGIQPLYQSTVKFLVASPQAAGQSALQSAELSRGRIASYAALVKDDKFVLRLLRGSGVELTPEEIKQGISGSGNRDTLLLTVVVTLPDSTKALTAATAIATNFSPAVNELENRSTTSPQTVLKIVSGPTQDTDPVSPRLGLNLGLGVLLGAFAGIGVAVSRRVMDRSLRTPEQVETATGLPLLARIPAAPEAMELGRLLAARPESLIDEAARRLRTNIDYLPLTPGLQAVTVTSATAEEGKTAVALMLSKAWADMGFSVLLLESDLRDPRLALDMGLTGTAGLSDVLTGQMSLDDTIQSTPQEGLHVLAAGTITQGPTELLASKRAERVLQDLRARYGKIVVDATALQPHSDAALMAARTDGAIVVVRHEHVSPDVLRSAIANLYAVGSKVLGVVVNVLPARLAETGWRGVGRPIQPKRAESEEPMEEPVRTQRTMTQKVITQQIAAQQDPILRPRPE